MLSHRTAALPISWHLFQTASTIWERLATALRERWQATEQKRGVSKLSPHLRQDMGEIDCRPPLPLPLSETLKSRQQALETMWPR